MKLPLLSKQQQSHSLEEKNKMEGNGGNYLREFAATGQGVEFFGAPNTSARLVANDQDFVWLRRQQEQEAVSNFDSWRARNFVAGPVRDERTREEIERDKIREARKQRIDLIKLRGPQNRQDIALLWALETGKLGWDDKKVEEAFIDFEKMQEHRERRRQEELVLAEREAVVLEEKRKREKQEKEKKKEEKEKVFAQGFAAGEKFVDRLKTILLDGIQNEGDYMFLRGVEKGELTKEGFMLAYLKNVGWHEEYIRTFSIELSCWQKYERCENCQRMAADFKTIESCKGCNELGVARSENVCMNCVRILFPDGLRGKSLYLSCGLCAVDARGAYEYVFGGSNEAGSRGEPTFVEGERADGGKVEAQQGEPGVHKRSSPEVGGSGEDDRFAEEDDLIV